VKKELSDKTLAAAGVRAYIVHVVSKPDDLSVDRRGFLRSAIAGTVTLLGPAEAAARGLDAGQAPADAPPPADGDVLTTDSAGSDFMVDVLKSLGFEFVCANPGSNFRGLHESVINYGRNQSPEFITCCHEESSVAMAHGYAKIEGKPLCVFAHGTVGLQHAAMAIYNAYCDRVPVYIVLGNTLDATKRQPGVEWAHSVQDAAAMVRDFVKWDDMPMSLDHFAESAVRAYKIAMTPPMLPVVLVTDSELQENPVRAGAPPRIPKLTLAAPPQGDSGAVAEAARLLVGAENPVIVVDRAARTPAGMKALVELAELLQAPVIDQGGRMNFPSRHPLNHSARTRALVAGADVILGLELTDFWGTVNSFRDQLERTSHPVTKSGARLISITAGDLFTKANYQDAQRYVDVDVAIAADAEATLPSLVEAIARQAHADRKRAFQARGTMLASAHQAAWDDARTEATYAWDASPISTARVAAELWAQIKNEDWSLVSRDRSLSSWPRRLWAFDKYYQYIGGPGGFGIGYGAPAAVGAALANRKHGRLSINIQNDGDLMYAPGVLWTAAHHRIPLLNIVHNNRAYHEEVMHVQRMANRRNRGIDRAWIGTTIDDPAVNFAKLAQSMGIYAEGPITDPKDLDPALRRAIAVVKRGEPALVDVVTQPR
jgi:thiamine pyrophosphate-dependent acetolactate synthase large subunit-like protein